MVLVGRRSWGEPDLWEPIDVWLYFAVLDVFIFDELLSVGLDIDGLVAVGSWGIAIGVLLYQVQSLRAHRVLLGHAGLYRVLVLH